MKIKIVKTTLKKTSIGLIFVLLASVGRYGIFSILWFLLLFLLFWAVYSNKKLLDAYALSIVLGYFVFLGFSNYVLLYQDPSNNPAKIKGAFNYLLSFAGLSSIAGLVLQMMTNKLNEKNRYIEISSTVLIAAVVLMIIGLGFQGFYLYSYSTSNPLFIIGAIVVTFGMFVLLVTLCDLFLRLISISILKVKALNNET